MWGTLVPFVVTLATADDKTIAHIERNDDLLSLRGSHSTLAEHLHAEVNVVVGRVDLLCDGSLLSTTADDGLHHQTVDDYVVVLCVCLRDDHISDVTPHGLACEIALC